MINEDKQDLDIVMPMFNLLYCSKNFRKTTGSFGIIIQINQILDIMCNLMVKLIMFMQEKKIFYPIRNSESFDYKTKLVVTLPAGNELRNIKNVVPLKNLSNFIFSLKFLMINTEIELILKWSQNCVLTEKATRKRKEVDGDFALVRAINIPTDLKFNITDCKLYVPVVTLQEKYENRL